MKHDGCRPLPFACQSQSLETGGEEDECTIWNKSKVTIAWLGVCTYTGTNSFSAI